MSRTPSGFRSREDEYGKRQAYPIFDGSTIGKPLRGSGFVHPSREAVHQARMTPKYRVLYVGKLLGTDYNGMNWYAAKELKLKFPYSKNTILIDKSLDADEKRRVIRHEKREIRLMKAGMHYEDAHVEVERQEWLGD